MCYIYTSNSAGRLAELADAHALGACGVTHKSSTLLSPTRNVALFVAVIVALKTKCCKVERVCIEGFNSRPSDRLRNYPPNSYVPTTAYFLAIPTSFF